MKLDDRALDELQDWAFRPQTGDVIDGRFELRQRIGEGGMGVVYAAYDRVDERVVAVKIVRGGGEHDTARFEREVHALEGVTHPALVKYVAHGVHEGVRYIVTERLEGCSLAERLRIGRLSIRDTIDLGVRIAAALGELHGAGVVHRDVKPANVFLVGDLEGSRTTGACLLDFGLARPADATTLTARGVLVGTPGYVAPERVRADDDARPPGDVFSLGCVLYECLLGAPPFAAETTYALLTRVLLEVAPLVRRERPDTPLGLEALVEQMLSKEPGERPPAVEVVRALEALRGALPRTAEDARREIAPGFAEGDVIAGKYRIEQRLGEGGMGVVLAARHLELGTHVAIKLLRAGDADEGRFLREAQAASRIESEHVVRVLDASRTPEGRPFIVMEHLRGEDLAQRLAGAGRLPVPVAVEYVLSACAALAEAHALGIVHRDLKPSNLFLVRRRDGSEIVKVLDFGISKLTRPLDASISHTATAESVVMGSIAYMAPEQFESSARADARSDIWSLGVVLYELVTGEKPFAGDNAVSVAARIAASPPKPLRSFVPDVSPALEALLARCLAKDPGARFGDVAALVVSLSSLNEAAAFERTARKRLAIATLASVAALVAVLVALASGRPSSNATKEPVTASPALTIATVTTTAPTPDPIPSATAPPSTSIALAPPLTTTVSATRTRVTTPPRTTAAHPATTPAPAISTPKRRDLDLRDPALEGR